MSATESTMYKLVGQTVLKLKNDMSHDAALFPHQIEGMAKQITATEYKDAFFERTKKAREDAGFSQPDMAKILQIKQGQYKQYEVRTLLPHRYIEIFCTATKVSVQWLFTGVEPSPSTSSRGNKKKSRAARKPAGELSAS